MRGHFHNRGSQRRSSPPPSRSGAATSRPRRFRGAPLRSAALHSAISTSTTRAQHQGLDHRSAPAVPEGKNIPFHNKSRLFQLYSAAVRAPETTAPSPKLAALPGSLPGLTPASITIGDVTAPPPLQLEQPLSFIPPARGQVVSPLVPAPSDAGMSRAISASFSSLSHRPPLSPHAHTSSIPTSLSSTLHSNYPVLAGIAAQEPRPAVQGAPPAGVSLPSTLFPTCLSLPLPARSKDLTAVEFALAFSLFCDFICSAYPYRRSELDDYLSIVLDMALRFGGGGIL